MKVLNLYAGIGGNRKLWEEVDVTAVEIDPVKAKLYADRFPDDEIVVADAHEFLIDHMDEYDFIWSSPPCPTHSLAPIGNKNQRVVDLNYPDMRLYQEVILLSQFANCDYVVENVVSYYKPLIEPQCTARHYFWSNFHIPDFPGECARTRGLVEDLEQAKGFSLAGEDLNRKEKTKILRNAINPELGKHIMKACTSGRQAKLGDLAY
jgi:DNA (cytosine-5)-methyltransferase 1